MIKYILNLLSMLSNQNCSVGMILHRNETPVLSSTFEEVKSGYFENVPMMLSEPSVPDGFTSILLSFVAAFVYIANFMGHINYQGNLGTECFVQMVDNINFIRGRNFILSSTAKKKFVILVGDHDHDFNYPGTSELPLIHLNKFGLIQTYCPTFHDKFWRGNQFYLDKFDLESFRCPTSSYIR